MKKHFYILPIFFFLAVFLVSCQHEESEVEEQNPENLTKTSELTTLLQRVASYDAPNDQAVDSTLCFSIKFPYSIYVHDSQGDEVSLEYEYDISNNEDLENATTIIDYLEFPEDDFSIIFPVTIVYPDHHEVVIESQAQFNAAKAACNENPQQGNINCININYPITIFGYNSNFQLANTYTITSDIMLFAFIFDLGDDEYYAIDYPISITKLNGDVLTINNNIELIGAVQNATADCSPITNPCANTNILTEDLIIYMPFANQTLDLISSENAIHNANYPPVFVADRDNNPNGAISFTGNPFDFLEIPATDINQLQQGDSLTVSLWFKMKNIDQGNLEYMFQKSEGVGNNALALGVYDGNTPLFMNQIGEGYNLWDLQWNGDLSLHTDTENWHHLVLTINGTTNTVRLFRDGVLRNVAENTNLNISTEFFNYFLGRSFNGYLDDLRVYRRLLTAGQVETLYNLPADNYTCVN